MVVIDGPVEFRMGSPPSEPDRIAENETPRRCIIPRRFAISAQEVSVKQFRIFLKDNPRIKHTYLQKYSPDPDGPQNFVTWYEAAAYCNWMSRKENLQECYEPNGLGEYGDGMKIRDDALQRSGYRLPTEGEWEYACRSGTETSRYYGGSVEPVKHDAWFNASSQGRAWRCGSLLPNDLGLFDTLGNVYEWCQEQIPTSEPNNDEAYIDEMKTSKVVLDGSHRPLRGGSFNDLAALVRSAFRIWNVPSSRYFDIGFRYTRSNP